MRSVSQPGRVICAPILATLLLSPAYALPAAKSRRDQAITMYERAVRMRTTLESQPENERRKADFEKVIRTFHEVYRYYPAYSKSPVALSAIAELYEEMGRIFSTDRYYLEAIKAYEFVVSEYPQSSLASDALFTVAEIYRTDLENPEQARKAFLQYLGKYFRSAKGREAREKLKQIDEILAERRPGPPAPPSETNEKERPKKFLEVTAVRRWVGPNYSRIVVGVEGEVKFDTVRLSNPDRIVLNLEGAHLSPALVGKTFPIEDGFLRQVRVAQFTPRVTRVVLDVKKIEDYSIFSLPNPYRLVIDIHGTKPRMAGKVPAPAESPAPAASSASKRSEGTVSESSAPPSGSSVETELASPDEAESKVEAPTSGVKVKRQQETDKTVKQRENEPVEAASVRPPPTLESSRAKGEASETPPREAGIPTSAAAPTEAGSRTLTRALGLKIGRIVLDPGHGGHDTGTLGPTNLREKDVVLDVGLRLRKLLERNTDCDVIMTRTDDTFIPLEERTAVANEKAADLFVSIHANASRDRSARGIETYYLNFTSSPDALEVAARENATSQESVHQLQDLIKKIAMTEKIEESQDFAKIVQREVHKRTVKISGQQRDRGVKKAPFVVLIGANMPSILAEISFLTNPRDERLLRRPDYRQRIAEALYNGILLYVKNLGGVKVAQRASSQQTSSATPLDF